MHLGPDRLYLPGTLPGEQVAPGPLTRRGESWAAEAAVLAPSPDRVTPPCRHFGPCGGCALQHWRDAPYAAWKHGLVADTLAQLGFEGTLPSLRRTPPRSRRRVDLAIARRNGAIQLGLHARRSDTIVDMLDCPVIHPRLLALVIALRPVLRALQGLRRAGSALVNLVDDGPDLLLRTDAPLTAADRQRLTTLAEAERLPRISWALHPRGEAEPACQLRPATLLISGRATPVPPGAFLQASPEGEAAIRDAVLASLPKLPAKARITELFAGIGTLTHALSDRAHIQAFEGDADAVQALRAANNPKVTATLRDLARQPLMATDLKGAHAVVLDPPWAGAAAQMSALAAARLPIVYVSCNPAALLRDGRVLLRAGHRVIAATAIDQFLWSARVEAVVLFEPGGSVS